jgi:hypothetical protein
MGGIREGEPDGRSPGPVYDGAIHRVLEGDPGAACRLLGIPVTTASGVPEVLSASFAYPVGSLYADHVMRVGPGRLAHVEFERQLSAEEMVARMVGYRGVIQRRHRREVLTQYLLVLGGGRVREFIDPVLSWFWRRLGVLFLRDLDPESLLDGPALAPLAVLAHGSSRVRSEALGRALALIRERGGERAEELRTCAVTLAGLTLDPTTIERTIEEVTMEMEEYVAKILRQGGAEDWLRRLSEARGREGLLIALMEERFGRHPETATLAKRLAAECDDAAAARAVTAATDLADLADLAHVPLSSA